SAENSRSLTSSSSRRYSAPLLWVTRFFPTLRSCSHLGCCLSTSYGSSSQFAAKYAPFRLQFLAAGAWIIFVSPADWIVGTLAVVFSLLCLLSFANTLRSKIATRANR